MTSSPSANASQPSGRHQLAPHVGEVGDRGGDDDEAGDHHRARDDEHDHLSRGDAPEGRALDGFGDGGHGRKTRVSGGLLRLGEHPKRWWGYLYPSRSVGGRAGAGPPGVRRRGRQPPRAWKLTTDSVMTSRTSTRASLQSRDRGLPQCLPARPAAPRRVADPPRRARPRRGPVRRRPRVADRRAQWIGLQPAAASRASEGLLATRVSAVVPHTRACREKRHRPRAAIAALLLGAIGLIVFYIGVDQLLRQDVPPRPVVSTTLPVLPSLVRSASCPRCCTQVLRVSGHQDQRCCC